MVQSSDIAAAALLAACSSCSVGSTTAPSTLPYLDDASYRRAELEAALVNPDDNYAKLRLARYASGDGQDWERLPEWNPPAETIEPGELDAPGGASTDTLSARAAPLTLPALSTVTSEDDPALVALGEAAFYRYPAQLASYMSVALTSRSAAAGYGLWTDPARGVGGLVRARMADGSGAVSLTCSTCHAAPAGGGLEAGLPNAALDVGAAILAARGIYGAPAASDPIAAWGPGRLDVTTTAGTEPVRISDLRPVRWLTYLQQDATLRARDLTTVAIRIETLIITSQQQALRPPRVVALALAAYVRSLAAGLPLAADAARAAPRGAAVFASMCAGCHVPDGLTGNPVPLATIGTDPTLGMSADRGTGTYRVPSLHGAGSRGPLLHDATVPSVGALFDPARPTATYASRLHGSGAVPGHLYGLGLGDADRAALVEYVGRL